MILLALRPADERQRDMVGLEKWLELRIVIVADGRHLDRYLAVGRFLVGTDEPESRISAHHLAVIAIQNAAARAVHRTHLDPVKSPQQFCPRSPWSPPLSLI